MKTLHHHLALATIVTLLVLSSTSFSHGQMTVNFGEVVPVSGPNDLVTLQFPESVVYAIDVWGDEDREVNGVLFLGDNTGEDIPGYRTDFTHTVTGWQNKPEYGDTIDDDNFEEINHDIRWTNNADGDAVGVHFEVEPNVEYTLQLLISGNHQEDRKWDIFVEDQLAVDEMDSNADQVYDQGISYAYTHTLVAPDDELNITFNQGTTGGDGNAILSAAILAITDSDIIPGDFNQDGAVDVADFEILKGNFRNTEASFFDGDMVFNRQVDLADFVAFASAFAEGGGGNAVPEPSTFMLLMLAVGSCALLFKTRKKRPLL